MSGVTGSRRRRTHLPTLESVDDTTLSNIRVPNEANTDLLFVTMYSSKLP